MITPAQKANFETFVCDKVGHKKRAAKTRVDNEKFCSSKEVLQELKEDESVIKRVISNFTISPFITAMILIKPNRVNSDKAIFLQFNFINFFSLFRIFCGKKTQLYGWHISIDILLCCHTAPPPSPG